MPKQMDHANYPKTLKGKTVAELRFIATDANEAVAANPCGANVNFYLDEVCYVSAELARREGK